MRVLVACEFSGTVRRAFAALGHERGSKRSSPDHPLKPAAAAVALSDKDLFRLEIVVRTWAERIRNEAAAFDDSPAPEVRAHAALLRQESDQLDMAADLLVGLQGDWDNLAPKVRAGFLRLKGEHEPNKAAAAAAKAEDVAA